MARNPLLASQKARSQCCTPFPHESFRFLVVRQSEIPCAVARVLLGVREAMAARTNYDPRNLFRLNASVARAHVTSAVFIAVAGSKRSRGQTGPSSAAEATSFPRDYVCPKGRAWLRTPEIRG